MEFANSVINLIGNIICLGLLVTFLVGLIFGIKFMIQAKTQDREEYLRKKEKDELERKVEMCNQALERIAIQEKERERRQTWFLPKIALCIALIALLGYVISWFAQFAWGAG